MRRGDLKAIGAGLLAAGALSATAVQAVAFIVTVFPISTIALNQGVNTVLNNNTEATNATLEAVKYRLGEFEKRLVAAIDGHAQSTMHSMAGNTVSAATQEANSSASIIQAQGALATQREREETAARLRLLRDMHGVLLDHPRGRGKTPGEFRRSQNWIGGTRPGDAHFVPPPPGRVEDIPHPPVR